MGFNPRSLVHDLMKLRKEDRTGLLVSISLHVIVLVVLSLVTASAREEQPMGFLEVEFGPLSEGRPVQQAPIREEAEPETEQEPLEEVERPPVSPPEEAKPVDLPDSELDIPDEEVVEAPEAEVIAPEERTTEEEEQLEEDEQPEQEVVQPLGSGSLDPDDEMDTGDEGTSNQEKASAPFRIEGLNRDPITTPLPSFLSQNSNVRVTVRITVDPLGNVTQALPVRRGDPTQDREVLRVVRGWRFNPLPANAPQEPQQGLITFVFTRR